MKENRIYVDGKLMSVCHNEYALLCNMDKFTKEHGKENVTLKRLDKVTNDEEKMEWLQRVGQI